jgi:hypothetical protein
MTNLLPTDGEERVARIQDLVEYYADGERTVEQVLRKVNKELYGAASDQVPIKFDSITNPWERIWRDIDEVFEDAEYTVTVEEVRLAMLNIALKEEEVW